MAACISAYQLVLLGVDFKAIVFYELLSIETDSTPRCSTGQFRQHLPRWHPYRCCIPQRLHRVLPTTEVGSYSCVFPRHDSTFMQGHPRWHTHVYPCAGPRQGRRCPHRTSSLNLPSPVVTLLSSPPSPPSLFVYFYSGSPSYLLSLAPAFPSFGRTSH